MALLSPRPNQPSHDLVFTPASLALEIISHFKPTGSVLDPCRGQGAFFNQFPSDCVSYWCEIEQGVDFFQFDKKVDWIVTNPPWSKIRSFLKHSYALTDNIVFLITINHLMTKARLREMREAGFGIKEFYLVETPKDKWPQSGFQLAAIYLKKDYTGPIVMID